MPKEGTKRRAHRAVHPNSRRAVQQAKEAMKKERKEKRNSVKKITTSALISKLMWFRSRLDDTKKVYSNDEALELVECYLQRHMAELTELESLQSDTRTASHYRLQHAGKEDSIRMLIVKEREMLEGPGFEAPDLTHPKHFQTFLKWKGEENLLPKLELKKYRKRKEDNASESTTSAQS